MKSGGYITYHGPLGELSRKLVEYFEVRLPPNIPYTLCQPEMVQHLRKLVEYCEVCLLPVIQFSA